MKKAGRISALGLAFVLASVGPQSVPARDDACRRRVVPVGISNAENNVVTGLTNFIATT